jgi:hypothetical protein
VEKILLETQAFPAGLRVFENLYCTISRQFRFPRSKRTRIRKKWSAQQLNYRNIPDPDVYVMELEGYIIGHPETIAKLKLKYKIARGTQ